MPRKTLIQNRRDTAAKWTSVNPVLADAEIGVESDTNKFKIGDGTSTWTELDYQTGTTGPQGPQGDPGPQGPQGEPGTGGTASFTYTQNTAATSWNITHNLGFHPNIATVDSAGSSIEGSITYNSVNDLTAVFAIATTGVAYLS